MPFCPPCRVRQPLSKGLTDGDSICMEQSVTLRMLSSSVTSCVATAEARFHLLFRSSTRRVHSLKAGLSSLQANKNSIVLTDPSDCLFLKRHTPAFCGVGIKTGSPAAFLHARLGLKDGSVFLDVVVLSGDNFLYVHMSVGLDRACRCIKFFTQRRSN